MTEQIIHKFNPREFVKNLPRKPGVYCMLDAAGEILYVGKARALQARVSSYFRSGAHDRKTQAMISQVADIQVSVTRTEAEALLLETISSRRTGRATTCCCATIRVIPTSI